jgi:hypothetical protein
MSQRLLMHFKSHTEGKNADVWIFPDRINYRQKGSWDSEHVVPLPFRSTRSQV